ncbi:MAG: hypothetical protein WB290_09070, partial [Smithella sp.]
MENKRPGRSRGGWLLPASAAVLICNAAYIAAFGAPTLFYVTNALLHPLLGLGVGILFVSFVIRHRRSFAGVWGIGALWLLGLAAGFGFYLVFVGMTRPHSLALYAHVGLAIAGLFFLLIRFRDRIWVGVAPEPESLPSVWRWSLRVAVAAGAFYAVVAVYNHAHS